MNTLNWSKFATSPMPLILLMLLTRAHSGHFGSAINLPDASLAVFFLAGFWFGGKRLLAFLLLEAAFIDYAAITYLDVNDYCVSPAYLFLIPTYAVLWLSGRFAGRRHSYLAVDSAIQLALLIGATLVAFGISNGSFYFFSGKFAELSWIDYSARIFKYLPLYLSSAVAYSVVIIAGVRLISSISGAQHSQNKAIKS